MQGEVFTVLESLIFFLLKRSIFLSADLKTKKDMWLKLFFEFENCLSQLVHTNYASKGKL